MRVLSAVVALVVLRAALRLVRRLLLGPPASRRPPTEFAAIHTGPTATNSPSLGEVHADVGLEPVAEFDQWKQFVDQSLNDESLGDVVSSGLRGIVRTASSKQWQIPVSTGDARESRGANDDADAGEDAKRNLRAEVSLDGRALAGIVVGSVALGLVIGLAVNDIASTATESDDGPSCSRIANLAELATLEPPSGRVDSMLVEISPRLASDLVDQRRNYADRVLRDRYWTDYGTHMRLQILVSAGC